MLVWNRYSDSLAQVPKKVVSSFVKDSTLILRAEPVSANRLSGRDQKS